MAFMKVFKKLFVVIFAFAAVGCAKSTNQNPVSVSGVELNYASYTLSPNDTFQLEAIVRPSNATNKNVIWRSLNTSIASVSSTGLVTALKTGTTKIHVTTVENSFFADCDISVIPSVIHVEKVTLNKSTLSIKQGKSTSIIATISPSTASNKNVTWTSSNNDVATVKNGLISGISQGEAVITAKSVDGGISASCNVTITEPVRVSGITLSAQTLSIKEGNTGTLTATISPSDAYDKSITWSSSNTSIASVDQKGVVTANAVGTATITATTTDGGFSANCKLTVNEKGSQDKWTILIYMCGSDLESSFANETSVEYEDEWGRTQTMSWDYVGFATSDILEILKVKNQPDDINIVIQTGGSKEWTTNSSALKSKEFGMRYGDEDINASKLQRWHVENNKIVRDDTLSTYTSMGNASTLQSFLEYGLNNYPAEKTGVVVWNHGGGLQGACVDEKKNNDLLEPSEIFSAISKAYSNTGLSNKKLEWLGYDCCLMQVQELAFLASDYFNYLIASQESEAGYGWDYDTWIDDLYTYKSTETILTSIVDGFIADNGGNSNENDQTLSYLDLSFASDYQNAWENMAAQLKTKITNQNKSKFGNLVKSCKYYADASYYYYGLFDAKDFINKLSSNSTFNPGSTYINPVLNAYSKLVKYSKKGGGAGNSNGLSMFWNIAQFYYDYGTLTTSECNNYSSEFGLPNWAYLCENFGATIFED